MNLTVSFLEEEIFEKQDLCFLDNFHLFSNIVFNTLKDIHKLNSFILNNYMHITLNVDTLPTEIILSIRNESYDRGLYTILKDYLKIIKIDFNVELRPCKIKEEYYFPNFSGWSTYSIKIKDREKFKKSIQKYYTYFKLLNKDMT